MDAFPSWGSAGCMQTLSDKFAHRRKKQCLQRAVMQWTAVKLTVSAAG